MRRAHFLIALGTNLDRLALDYRVMNSRALSWCAAGGIVFALVALLCVVPIRGQGGAVVDGPSHQIERLQDRQQVLTVDMVKLTAKVDALVEDVATAKQIVERSFWGILAILGSILYRSAMAFWALRKGWLVPPDPKL